MEKEIVVGLLSSGASIAAAAFAWFQAVRVSRSSGETSVQVAQLQADLEKRKRALEVALSESKPIEDALDWAWRDLQTIKEVVARLLASHEFDREATTAELRLALARLSSGYAEHGVRLSASAQQAWHTAKSTAGAAGMLLLRNGQLIDDAGAMADRLQSFRETLTERQATIFNERHNVRERLTRRVLELL